MAANIAIFPLGLQFRQRRQFNRTFDHLERYNNHKLFKRYRFERDGILYICDLVRNDLERETKRAKALSVEVQVLLALRFFASGAFLEAIGDTLGVDKASVSRAIRDVSNALHARKDEFIQWPVDPLQRREIRRGFYNIAGFPRVIGCIDGTHVRIQAPNAPMLPAALALPVQADDQAQGGPVDDDAEQPEQQQPEQDADAMDMDALPLDRHHHDHDDHVNPYDQPPVQLQRIPNYEASFVNRKGYHSLNIQAVCDHTGKLMLYLHIYAILVD
jgi:hypothetical protein